MCGLFWSWRVARPLRAKGCRETILMKKKAFLMYFSTDVLY